MSTAQSYMLHHHNSHFRKSQDPWHWPTRTYPRLPQHSQNQVSTRDDSAWSINLTYIEEVESTKTFDFWSSPSSWISTLNSKWSHTQINESRADLHHSHFLWSKFDRKQHRGSSWEPTTRSSLALLALTQLSQSNNIGRFRKSQDDVLR